MEVLALTRMTAMRGGSRKEKRRGIVGRDPRQFLGGLCCKGEQRNGSVTGRGREVKREFGLSVHLFSRWKKIIVCLSADSNEGEGRPA